MKTYKITATLNINLVTLVMAKNEEEALKMADDGRDVSICIHGAEHAGIPDNEWVLSSEMTYDEPTVDEAEEQ